MLPLGGIQISGKIDESMDREQMKHLPSHMISDQRSRQRLMNILAG
jgi:hypothetical protein